MTNEQFTEIDQHVTSLGWLYNADSEQFEKSATHAIVGWEDVIVAMPQLSLNELDAFAERKQRDRLRTA